MRKSKDKSQCSSSGNFCEKLYRQLGIPEKPFSGCSMEIQGRNQALIYGCIKIEEYSENTIRLRMKGFDLVFFGEELGCPAFGGGRLMLKGVIRSIAYEERDS